eukprot:Hpha_TRINITY_DN35144_c0_g1::TRINITY_DN35144_c0_g1_i1::g.168356::m.168356
MRMRVRFSAVAVMCCAMPHTVAADYDKKAVTAVVASTGLEVYGSDSATDTDISAVAEELALRVAPPDQQFGCETLKPASVYAGSAVLLLRGGCMFQEKIRNAVSAGAAAVLIAGTLESLYDKHGLLTDPCSVDCGLGRSDSQQGCEELCGGPCANSTEDWCCVLDRVLDMNPGNLSKAEIPAVGLSVVGGQRLLSVAHDHDDVVIKMSYRAPRKLELSSLAIWFLGVCTVVIASWRATRQDRKRSVTVSGRQDEAAGYEDDDGVPVQDVTVVQAVIIAMC